MATNDKFIQSMLELLDKLIDHQSKNANLLGEIKSALHEVRHENTSILDNLRDKLPTTISREQEYLHDKLASLADKVEESNNKLVENMNNYASEYDSLKHLIEEHTKILNENCDLLKKIYTNTNEKEEQKQKVNELLVNINGFIDSLKSKRFWIAAIAGALAALATALSSIMNAYEVMTK
jgi:chromosome segregation ATPase